MDLKTEDRRQKKEEVLAELRREKRRSCAEENQELWTSNPVFVNR